MGDERKKVNLNFSCVELIAYQGLVGSMYSLVHVGLHCELVNSIHLWRPFDCYFGGGELQCEHVLLCVSSSSLNLLTGGISENYIFF